MKIATKCYKILNILFLIYVVIRVMLMYRFILVGFLGKHADMSNLSCPNNDLGNVSDVLPQAFMLMVVIIILDLFICSFMLIYAKLLVPKFKLMSIFRLIFKKTNEKDDELDELCVLDTDVCQMELLFVILAALSVPVVSFFCYVILVPITVIISMNSPAFLSIQMYYSVYDIFASFIFFVFTIILAVITVFVSFCHMITVNLEMKLPR